MTFVGASQHFVDPKGRVVLPAKFRKPFGSGALLCPYESGCLALWTQEGFGELTARLRERSSETPEQRNVLRVWSSRAEEVSLDSQHRLLLTSPLRGFAGIGDAVLFSGAIDHVELWDPARWEERVAPAGGLIESMLF
jgi:MraZ protein